MLNIILILYGIIGILLIIETRLISNIVYFIIMIILLSIYLIYHPILSTMGISYFSYNLIIIEIGAVSILFGIIILILPEKIEKLEKKEIWYKGKSYRRKLGTIISLLILFPFYINHSKIPSFPLDIIPLDNFNIVNSLGNEFFTHPIYFRNILWIALYLLIPILGIFTILKSALILKEA